VIIIDIEIVYIKSAFYLYLCLFVCLMLFNATFINISVMLWLSVLLMEETGGPRENH
jgi:hypothetical protein